MMARWYLALTFPSALASFTGWWIHAATLMARLDQYEAFIQEEHHSRKRDAPSGTALEVERADGPQHQARDPHCLDAGRAHSWHPSRRLRLGGGSDPADAQRRVRAKGSLRERCWRRAGSWAAKAFTNLVTLLMKYWRTEGSIFHLSFIIFIAIAATRRNLRTVRVNGK